MALFSRHRRRRNGCIAVGAITVCPVMLLALILVSLSFTAMPTEGFPFGRSSGVTELTPSLLPSFVNTHKPVVILFYAPWCGHCKQFHPEYERFAAAVKGAVRVGAINADEHSDIGRQYSIQGFPTIKYWQAGSKSIASPSEYQGQRSANSLQSFIMAGVRPDKVKQTVKSVDDLREMVESAPGKKAAVLFTAKTKVPPIFSILALSAKLQQLPFVFVTEGSAKARGAASALGVTQLPTLAVVQLTDAAGAGDSALSVVPYKGKGFAYEPMAKFFLAAIEDKLTESVANGAGGDTGASTTLLDEEVGAAAPGREARLSVKALPVVPVDFDPDVTLPAFCAPPASEGRRLHGKVVWCVVVRSSKIELEEVHAAFQNEPFLFFDAEGVLLGDLDAALHAHLDGLSVNDFGDAPSVLLVRKPKAGTIRYQGLDGIHTADALQRELQKLVGGELRTKTKKLSEVS